MEVLYRRVCGIDVHKQFLVACVLVLDAHGHLTKEVRRFTTLFDDLLAVADWLTQHGVTHVAMESTGVYVRRITARAIPPAGRLGSEGNPGVNNLPHRES